MQRETLQLISQVADRALAELEGWDKITIVLDLSNCIKGGCDLDLESMLTCDMWDLLHDITGINHHLDHLTLKLTDCFSPRMRKRS